MNFFPTYPLLFQTVTLSPIYFIFPFFTTYLFIPIFSSFSFCYENKLILNEFSNSSFYSNQKQVTPEEGLRGNVVIIRNEFKLQLKDFMLISQKGKAWIHLFLPSNAVTKGCFTSIPWLLPYELAEISIICDRSVMTDVHSTPW